MSIDDYIGLLKWTGSIVAPSKRGKLEPAPSPSRARRKPRNTASEPTILREAGISAEGW